MADENTMDTRITKLEDKVGQIDKSLGIFTAIFDRNLAVQEQLSLSIDNFSKALIEIQLTMKDMRNEIKENSNTAQSLSVEMANQRANFASEIVRLSSDISSTKKLVDAVDEKGKIDVTKLLSEWGTKLLLGGLVTASIVSLIIEAILKIKTP